MRTIKERSLYLVITEEHCAGRSAVDVARRAIDGGVDIVQMREKGRPAEELLNVGKGLSELCKSKGVIFIVNDDPLLAREVGADGVHLGQEDIARLSINEARRIIGAGKLIGLSAGSRGQFETANEEDVDYIALGPIFPTKLKEDPIGTGDIGHVMRIAKKPVVFIGGINKENVDKILDLGGRNIAVIRAIAEAADIKMSARQLKDKLRINRKPKHKDPGGLDGRPAGTR